MATVVKKVPKLTKSGKLSKAPFHTQVYTQGLSDVARILAFEAPPNIRKAFFDGLVEATRPALYRAKMLAPKRTGNLSSLLELRARRGKRSRDIGTVQIGGKGEYIGVMEFARGEAPVRPYQRAGYQVSAHIRRYYLLSQKHGQAPRFLVPAVEQEADNIGRAVEAHVARYLEQILNGNFTRVDD